MLCTTKSPTISYVHIDIWQVPCCIDNTLSFADYINSYREELYSTNIYVGSENVLMGREVILICLPAL